MQIQHNEPSPVAAFGRDCQLNFMKPRGLKTRTIYDMVGQRRIPFRKAGDRIIFLLDEILEWTKPNGEDSIRAIPSNGLRSARKE